MSNPYYVLKNNLCNRNLWVICNYLCNCPHRPQFHTSFELIELPNFRDATLAKMSFCDNLCLHFLYKKQSYHSHFSLKKEYLTNLLNNNGKVQRFNNFSRGGSLICHFTRR